MKTALWIFFGAIGAVWTALAYVVASVTGLVADRLAAGVPIDAGALVGELNLPQWLAHEVDPAAIEEIQRGILAALHGLQEVLPWVGVVLGWVVPLVWVAWGLVALMLLAIAVAAVAAVDAFGRAASQPTASQPK